MIFVTLGSQKFQFNRLLAAVDKLIDKNVINDEVFAQTGCSDYRPENYKYKQFLDRNEFEEWENKCDIMITHGGTGAIIGAVKKGKKVVAVPRLAKYGEHVDDHQMQLLKQFEDMDIIESCYDLSRLGKAVEVARKKEYKQYVSNTKKIIDSIESYISDSGK